MADAVSIEQNNKIRVALGFNPLPVPGKDDVDNGTPDGGAGGDSGQEQEQEQEQEEEKEEGATGDTLESRHALASSNWSQLNAEREALQRREARKKQIQRAREVAQRDAKLAGKSLGQIGEEEGANTDTKTWLAGMRKKQKKIEKERAARLAAELEERERERLVNYSAKDLAGVVVGHEVEDFDKIAGSGVSGEHVLTLRDTTIDEDEAADGNIELESVQLRENEKLQERLESKKKRVAYDPTKYEESGTGGVLSHYDEEIEGKKRKHFALGSDDISLGQVQRQKEQEQTTSQGGKKLVNLDALLAVTAPSSDYQDPSEVKIKKPKKSKKNKKTKTTRRPHGDDDDDNEAGVPPETQPPTTTTTTPPTTVTNATPESMQIDSALSPPAPKKTEVSAFLEDEDLQNSLAMQRRTAFKKRRKQLRPEDIARQVRDGSDAGAGAGEGDDDGDTQMRGDGGKYGEQADESGEIVLDATSEFVANFTNAVVERPGDGAGQQHKQQVPTAHQQQDDDEDEDEEDISMAADQPHPLAEKTPEPQNEDEQQNEHKDVTSTGLNEERSLNEGVGAALAMLRQRGLVEETDPAEKSDLHRGRQAFLLEKRRLQADMERRARLQRERDRESGKLDRMTAREREEYARRENKAREQLEARMMSELFQKYYQPDVQVTYTDETGREMDQKESFKYMSHQFHGKGSGKMKTEKHMKKVQDERNREAMNALDGSGLVSGRGDGSGQKQAGVRLG